MEVQNQRFCSNINPSFQAIKNVRVLGLYNKYPEFGKDLVDTFALNSKAMDFCKKYDVNIIFDAVKSFNSVDASVHIFYDNIAKSKFRKIMDFLTSNEDKISLYFVQDDIAKCTEEMKNAISSTSSFFNKNANGMLESHIKLADEQMEAALNTKRLAKTKHETKVSLLEQINEKHKKDKEQLDSTILYIKRQSGNKD